MQRKNVNKSSNIKTNQLNKNKQKKINNLQKNNNNASSNNSKQNISKEQRNNTNIIKKNNINNITQDMPFVKIDEIGNITIHVEKRIGHIIGAFRACADIRVGVLGMAKELADTIETGIAAEGNAIEYLALIRQLVELSPWHPMSTIPLVNGDDKTSVFRFHRP